ncbi:MAG: cysteine synthase family protein [Verrucomicrobiota bacterium]
MPRIHDFGAFSKTTATSVLEAIGGTPLIGLDRIYTGPGRLVAKAEFLQPGGSIKDRAALHLIRSARDSGALHEGQTVVEMTSGNMGSGLAIVCGIMGHPFVAVMSAGNSPERATMMRRLGAEVVLEPQVDGSPGRVTGRDIEAATGRAEMIVQSRDAYFADQFNAEACVLAHAEGTGPEILEQLNGRLSAFVASVGTGGTFVGCARHFRAMAATAECFAVEPEGAEFLAGKPITRQAHLLQGTGYCRTPRFWDPALCDGFFAVSDAEACSSREELGKLEGLYVGFSSAANVAASIRYLHQRNDPDCVVATILCDSGLKYPG